jgi:hypothetical protein
VLLHSVGAAIHLEERYNALAVTDGASVYTTVRSLDWSQFTWHCWCSGPSSPIIPLCSSWLPDLYMLYCIIGDAGPCMLLGPLRALALP